MRIAVALLLLALVASAEEVLVRVTHEDEPVADAGVVVLDGKQLVFDPTTFEPDWVTDDSGVALVRVSPEERIAVYRAGYELMIHEVRGALVDVELRWETPFSGRVLRTDGEPVAGATVLMETQVNQRLRFRVAADARGRFVIYGVPFDRYKLFVEHDGFLARELDVNRTGLDEPIVLVRPGVISGTLRDREGKPRGGGAHFDFQGRGPDGGGRLVSLRVLPSPYVRSRARLAVRLEAHDRGGRRRTGGRRSVDRRGAARHRTGPGGGRDRRADPERARRDVRHR